MTPLPPPTNEIRGLEALTLAPLPPVPRPATTNRSDFVTRWLSRSAFLLIAIAISFGGYKYVLPSFLGSRTLDRPVTARVSKGELKVTITDRGELESLNAVQVNCELQGGGKLVSILDEGKRVSKGDEVAKLDTDTLTKSLNEQEVKWQTAVGKANSSKSELSQAKNKAKSEIAKAELALTLAKIDLESYDDEQGEYKRDVDKLKGALELKRKQLKEAEDDIQFTKGLIKDGYAQLEQLRAKELSVQQSRFEVTSAEAEVRLLEKFTRKRKLTELKAKAEEAARELERTEESQKAAIEKAESDLRAAESNEQIEKKQLEYIKQQIERCTIKAPSDGILVYSNARYWDESSRIRPGAQLYYRQEIFSLPDLSRMRVKMKIHESVIKKVKVGMTATYQIDALPNRTLNGSVTKIATIAQSDGWRGAGVKQYETELSIDDLPSDAGLKPGMTCEVKLLVGTVADAISVPIAAVTEYDSEKVVYVVTPRAITRRKVTVGESNDQFVQIVEGLSVDEEVALDARSRAAGDMKSNEPKKEKDPEPTEKSLPKKI